MKSQAPQLHPALARLREALEGELRLDATARVLYATDASDYKEMPLAVVIPKTEEDIRQCILAARALGVSLIPRTAGTSLAGQVVGPGIVVDVSKHFNQILELNTRERWVRVQPGVVRDELNQFLKPHGLFFGPETSTSNRCMIGGMVGNNSCGAQSIIYQTTREHTLEVEAFLSDGSKATFKALRPDEFAQKCELPGLEGEIHRQARAMLSDPANRAEIRQHFPRPEIYRRNTGYAIDKLMECELFEPGHDAPFNFCKLLAGSEGTLAFSTQIKLALVDAPAPFVGVLCAHFDSLQDALKANLIALKHGPGAVELMDDIVLECTENSAEHQHNRFFVQGRPKAMLMIEFRRQSQEEVRQIAEDLERDLRAAGYGYHFPLVEDERTKQVWNLRKAGLGLLANVPGDLRSTTVIEDTAVHVDDLPAYIEEFDKTLRQHGVSCVYYAHAGSGELHLRPMLNLKTPEHVELFHTLGHDIAKLVKRYRGSLSGEHGDGRLRGEFVAMMVGPRNYELLRQVKRAWDPAGVFNPGKITDAPPMREKLKYKLGPTPGWRTYFDFSAEQGITRAAEKCTGSGDCRKSHKIGGAMCPSYMATRDESATTRARANILKEFLSDPDLRNPFDHPEIMEVMDLCLSCKSCKAECPSGVDVAKLKAEFLQHYYDANGVPARVNALAHFPLANRVGALLPGVANRLLAGKASSAVFKKALGIAPERSIPPLSSPTLLAWHQAVGARREGIAPLRPQRQPVLFFADEFTNYLDAHIGQDALRLLWRLGYSTEVPAVELSGRTFLSKGLVKKAREYARRNVALLAGYARNGYAIVGVEPSTLLTLRDEYPELVPAHQRADARALAGAALLFDEFAAGAIERGEWLKSDFDEQERTIHYHGHCFQKALSSTRHSIKALGFPLRHQVREIPSGCCGMAGFFGYEAEHYELSMKIGELVLLPAARKAPADHLLAAIGNSCRHQIRDGAAREALHTAEILWQAVRK